MQDRALFRVCALASAVLALTACNETAEAPEEPTAPAAQLSDGPPGISAADGWMNLPAVDGNPGAAYFTLSNGNAEGRKIVSASVLGAESASLHGEGMVPLEEVDLPPQSELTFSPGGMHVMAMGLDPSLSAGSTSEATLTFDNGDKVSIPLQLRSAGDAPN